MKDLDKLSKTELIAEVKELRKMQQMIIQSSSKNIDSQIDFKNNEDSYKLLYNNTPLPYQSLVN